MPELPEVETVARGLARVMEGVRFDSVQVNRPDLRFPFPKDFAARLTGQSVTSIGRRAKYILAHLSDGDVLLMHLGMSGRFLIHEASGTNRPGRFYHDADGPGRGDPHAHVVFRLEDGTRIVYSDPRRFGVMDVFSRGQLTEHKLLKDLGIEPLGNELSGAFLNQALRTKQTPLKAALLDQKIIVGVGNIYACEALFRASLSPKRLARTITSKAGSTDRATRLADSIREVLGDAIAAGGSTLRDYVRTDGELGYFQHAFQVYDREGADCPRHGCDGTIGRIVQSNRSTFYCPRCQK